jgi:hypothetical protein
MHRSEVEDGTASFKGIRVSRSTTLRKYAAAFSLVFVSFRVQGRYYLDGEDGAFGHALALIVAALIYVWWSIPSGPVNTLRVLGANLTRGSSTTVAEILPRW